MPHPYSLTASKGQGLTQMLNAYVKKLQSEGKAEISGGKIDKKEWENTINKLAEINNTRKTANKASIFTGGSDAASKDYGSNFVVQDGQQIDFDENEMNSLLASMGVTLKGQPQQAAATEPTTPVTNPEGDTKAPTTNPITQREQTAPITALTPKKAEPIKTDTPKINLEKRETTRPVIGNHEPEEIPPTQPVRDEVPVETPPAGTTPQIVDNGDGSRTITNPDGSRTEQRRIPRGTEETLYDNQGRKIKESKDILGPQGHDIETYFNPETGKKTKSIDKPLGDKGATITTEFDEQGREIKKTTSQNGQSSSVENSYSGDGAQPSQTKTTYKSGNTMTETFTANLDGTKKGVRVHSNNPSIEETVNYNSLGGQTTIETRENGVLTKVEDKANQKEQTLNYKSSGIFGSGKKRLTSISEKMTGIAAPPATEIKFEQDRQNGNLSTIRQENPITQNPITYNVGENGIQNFQMNNMTFTRNDQGEISFKQGDKHYEYKKEGDKMKLYQNGTEIEPMSQFKYERLNNQFLEGDRYLDIYKKAQQ